MEGTVRHARKLPEGPIGRRLVCVPSRKPHLPHPHLTVEQRVLAGAKVVRWVWYVLQGRIAELDAGLPA